MRVKIGKKIIKIRELTFFEKQKFNTIKNKQETINYLKKIKAFKVTR